MRESIFLNKNEMVSFYWVNVEIGRGAGNFLDTLYLLALDLAVPFAAPINAHRSGLRRLTSNAYFYGSLR
jgi:hypothetical protein